MQQPAILMLEFTSWRGEQVEEFVMIVSTTPWGATVRNADPSSSRILTGILEIPMFVSVSFHWYHLQPEFKWFSLNMKSVYCKEQ